MSYADKKRTARRILDATERSPIIVYKRTRKNFYGYTQYRSVFGSTVRGQELIKRDQHLIVGCFHGAGGEEAFLRMVKDDFFEPNRIAA